mmetsp:Transcript_12526/g.31808  ORF Transcript_12526/g.31808 Transcript_12526/m.31808 type:complete len:230 (+) Transcript_12526:270-959(+)
MKRIKCSVPLRGTQAYTRMGSSSSFASSMYTSVKSANDKSKVWAIIGVPMSCTIVTPFDSAYCIACLMAPFLSGFVKGGFRLCTMLIALSFRMPLGVPRSLYIPMAPPSGSVLSFVMLARFNATVLTRARWPSTLDSRTGFSLVASSIQSASGIPSPPHLFSSQPYPISHMPGSMFLDASLTLLMNSALELTPRRSSWESDSPPRIMCTWLSIRPGIQYFPFKSNNSAP